MTSSILSRRTPKGRFNVGGNTGISIVFSRLLGASSVGEFHKKRDSRAFMEPHTLDHKWPRSLLVASGSET